MKTFGFFLIIAVTILLAIEIVNYFRFIKLHKKQIEQLVGLIADLKKKQTILNQQVKIIQLSEEHQKAKLHTIYSKIFKAIKQHILYK